jgi:translation initiation factor eIF-2B subunit delta
VPEANTAQRLADEALAEIAADRARGAAELAARGIELLAAVAEAEVRAGRPILPATRAVARRLRDSRPAMAPIGNWAAAFIAALAGRPNEPAPWHGAVAAMAEAREGIAVGQCAASRDMLARADAVLTLSYSSSVARLLASAEAPRRVIVAEGRPLFEGRRLVEALHSAKRDAICITDAAIPHFVAEASAVLIGADSVCRDGAAINKVGSLSAALAARHHGVPFYVAADRFKLAPRLRSTEAPLEEKAGDEVWPEHPGLCLNPYFEAVPAELITAYVMETGLRRPAELAAEFTEIEALAQVVKDP